MSQSEENTQHELELNTSEATPATDSAPEESAPNVEESSAAHAAPSKAVSFGTRKRRPGSAAAPAAPSPSQVSSILDDEEIEMDDLPVRANAPAHLIDEARSEERRPRSDRPSRGGRRKRSYDSSDSASSETEETQANAETSSQTEENLKEEGRPDRFGTVNTERRGSPVVQEFRPSRDGRSSRKPRERGEDQRSSSRSPKQPAPKKGFLSKVVAFLTGADEEEEKKKEERRDKRHSRGDTGNRRRRSSRGKGRGRGPESGDRPSGQGGGGQRRSKGGGRRRSGNGSRRRRSNPRPEASRQD